MPDRDQDFIDAVNAQRTPAASSAGGDRDQDFIDVVNAQRGTAQGTPAASTTPETDKAAGETDSLFHRFIGFARKPSPAWMQPAERFIREQALVPKETMPLYWWGRGAQEAAQFLPPSIRPAAEIAGGISVGVSEAASSFTTPANLGLAATTGGLGKVGQLLVSGAFLGQAIKGTPEQWRALKAAPTWGEKARIAAQMGASYIPALGVVEGVRQVREGLPGPPVAPAATIAAQPRVVPPGGEPVRPPVEPTGAVGEVVPQEEGVPDASKIRGAAQVPELEVRPQVGKEARVLTEGAPTGARPGEEPIPAAERPVAAEPPAATTPDESLIPTAETPVETPNARITDFNADYVKSPEFEKTMERAALMNTRWIRLHYPDGSTRNFKVDADYLMGVTGEPVTKGMGIQVEGLKPSELPLAPPPEEKEKARVPREEIPIDPDQLRASHLQGLLAEYRNRNPGVPDPVTLTSELQQLEEKITGKLPPPREPTRLSMPEQAHLKELEGLAADQQNEVGNYYIEGEPRKKFSKQEAQQATDAMHKLFNTWDQIHRYWEQSGQPYDIITTGGAGGLKLAGHSPYEGRRVLILEKEPRTGGQAKESLELFNVGAGTAGVTGRDYFDKKLFTARVSGADVKTQTPIIDIIPKPDGTLDVVTGHKMKDPQTGRETTRVIKTYNTNRVYLSPGSGIRKTGRGGEPLYEGQDLTGFGNAERLKRNAKGGTGLIYGAANSSTQGIVGGLRPGGAKHMIVVSRHIFGPEASENQDTRVQAHRKAKRVDLVTGTIERVTKNPDGTYKVKVGPSDDNPNANYSYNVDWVENFLGGPLQTDWLPAGIKKVGDQIWVRDASLKTSMPGVYAGGDARISLPGEGKGARIDIAEGDAAKTAVLLNKEIAIKRATGKLPSWQATSEEIHGLDQEAKILRGMKPTEEEKATTGVGPEVPGAGGKTGARPPTTTPVSRETPPTITRNLPPPTPVGERGAGPPPITPTEQRPARADLSSGAYPVGSPSTREEARVATPEETQRNVGDTALIGTVREKPRTLTPEEDAALRKREETLVAKSDAIANEIIDAAMEGDFERQAENDLKQAEVLDKLNNVRQARQSGKPPPDLNVAGDFSLENMRRQKRGIKGGVDLLPEEEEEVQRAHDKIQAATEAVEDYRATPQAKQYWESLKKRAEAYRTGKGKKEQLIFDPAHLSKMAEDMKAKDAWWEELERDRRERLQWWQKVPDWLLKWRRAFIISGIHSVVKLASATAQGTIIIPARELVGEGLRHLPLISEVAKRAPREGGGFNIRAETRAQTEMWKNLLSDFTKNIKGEKPEYETVFGSYRNLPPELQNYMGYFHSALKSPLARNEFFRSLEKRTEFAARHGTDITEPLVQMELGRQALEDSQFWRFQNKNLAAGAYRNLVSWLQRHGAWGKTGAFALQGELPIVTVPTNIMARAFEGVFGTIPGLVRLANAYRKGIENLTPAQADLIMRNLKSGSLGLALTMLGAANPQMFGGFYRPGTKKDPDDPSWGEIKFGDTRIPAYLQDNPFVILPQFGATMVQVAGSLLRKSDAETAGMWMGLWSASMGLATTQPYLRESLDITKAFDARTAGDVLGEHARSYLIPMLIQQSASITDPAQRRYPRGFQQRIMMGIPGQREQIPDIVPPPQQMGIRRRGITPSRHLRAHR